MKIGIVGPISTESILPYLKVPQSALPVGYLGAPVLGSLIGALLDKGYSVSAFTTSPDLPVTPSGTVAAQGDRFQIYYCPVRPHGFRPKGGHIGRAFDFFRIERHALRTAILQEGPDVVHAHWTYEFALAAIESGLPHVVTCHDAPQMVLRHKPDRYRLVRYFMARRALRRAQYVTAVSPYLKHVMHRYTATTIDVVPNPLPDFLCNNPLPVRRLDRARPRLAMILNGWSRLKNPKPALRAFSMLRKSIPNAEMTLYGTDYGPTEIADRWIRAHGLHAGITCVGRIPHSTLLRRLADHDALIHPSLLESCCMSIAEAMALGLPIVGGDSSGGVPWMVGDGGLTTNIRSPYAIASSLQKLLLDDVCYMELSANAMRRAHSLFSMDRIVTHYREIYHTLFNKGHGLYNDATIDIGRVNAR